MIASDIIKLLKAKHSEDVFVSECKDGPTQSVRNYLRMDAWVMPRSWTRQAITAYEVKVSRSDFLGDEKWRNYLPLCNYFYFATAPGLIQLNELPTEVGLIEASKSGSRLFIKRKAVHHEATNIEGVLRYVLMCRSTIRGETTESGKREFWKTWLETRQIDATFGHNLSKKLRETIDKEIILARHENENLLRKMETYDSHRQILDRLKLDHNVSSWRFENNLNELRAGISDQEIRNMEDLSLSLSRIASKLKNPILA